MNIDVQQEDEKNEYSPKIQLEPSGNRLQLLVKAFNLTSSSAVKPWNNIEYSDKIWGGLIPDPKIRSEILNNAQESCQSSFEVCFSIWNFINNFFRENLFIYWKNIILLNNLIIWIE